MSLLFVQLRAHSGRRAYTDLSAFCGTFQVRLGNENPASCGRWGLDHHLKSLRTGKEATALEPQISTWFTEPTFDFHPIHRWWKITALSSRWRLLDTLPKLFFRPVVCPLFPSLSSAWKQC